MKIQKYTRQFFGIFITMLFLYGSVVYATDLTSTSFIVRDPIVGTGGGYGTSASFASYISGNMTTIGKGTSASFEGRSGFLWYPYVTQGSFTATANGSQADLAWGASASGLGWNISGYSTGKATVSGGPYTYISVGNVTSYSYTGLAPGLYCFVLRTLDAFSNVIATSSEQCITIQPTLSFANDDATIGFGTLSSGAATYANGAATGSASTTTAHTMTIGTNATTGYTLTYNGATLTSGANTITPATITGSATGTAGSSQFALAATVTGTGTATTAYAAASNNWKFQASTTDQVASATGPVASDTVAMRYLANIPTSQAAGAYATNITYILTGNF